MTDSGESDEVQDRRRAGAEALAYLLDARHVPDSDRPPPALDETLDLFREFYAQTPIQRIGFVALARVYARLDDAGAAKLLIKAGELSSQDKRQDPG